MAINVETGAEVQRPLATDVIDDIISLSSLTLPGLSVLYATLTRHEHVQKYTDKIAF